MISFTITDCSFPYGLIKLMAANHIDFQNLIPESIAIDFNTLKQ